MKAPKSKKEKKDLTPLEKARMAKASGKAPKGKKAKTGKAALPTWKTPDEFKPFFLEVVVKTEKDGLLCQAIKATRYVGRYDPQVPDKKKFDLASYDSPTLMGLLSRLSATTYTSNVKKRLPGNQTYKLLLRVNNKKAAGNVLSVLCKSIWVAAKDAKTGRIKAVALDKKDPQYRAFRKATRILPAAFKDCLMPPKRVRGVKVKEEDSDD